MTQRADPTPFDSGRFGSHKLLLSNKSMASLLPDAMARLNGDCPYKNNLIAQVVRFKMYDLYFNTLQIRFGLAECSRSNFMTLTEFGSFLAHAICSGVLPTRYSVISYLKVMVLLTFQLF